MAGRVAGMAEVAGKLGVALEGLQGDDVASMASLTAVSSVITKGSRPFSFDYLKNYV